MLLTVGNVSKSFGADGVLEGVSFRIDRREKVALVGRNGTGKTTLLRILTGELEPDGGTVQWARGVSIGYLRQHQQLDPQRTVLEEAESARQHLRDLEIRLRELEAKLEHDPSADDLDEYTMLHEHFHAEGGYAVENDLRVVLARMGFREDEFEKRVGALSGGEKTRLMLGKLLLQQPDLLILDEPTNHLDLEATEWLEAWLRGYGGAVLLVSHDRTFLQNVAGRVLELRNGTVKAYAGPFDKFLKLREEEEARLAEVARRQQDQIDKLDEFVRRFINSQRTAQARGRQKLMNRLIAEKVDAPSREKGISAGFSAAKRSGDLVMEAQRLSMAFGEERLFQELDWTVRWGERWGVIGGNGAGKSTLAKVMLRRLEPVGGRARMGAGVETGYFSQDATDIDLDHSPLQVMAEETGLEAGPARDLLGRFLIQGDDAFRPARTLSGGERNKLLLAVLTALQPNLLLLDEPTNHLDMDSREALVEVLREYNGTLVVISHDRYLLNAVTDQTLDLRSDGSWRIFPGSYDDYRRYTRGGGGPVPPSVARAPEAPKPTLSPRELSKEIDRLEKQVAEWEARITRLEGDLKDLETVMSAPPEGADLLALSTRYQSLSGELESALGKWESTSRRVEELRSMRGGR